MIGLHQETSQPQVSHRNLQHTAVLQGHDLLTARSNTSYADCHTAPITSYVFLEDAVCWRICWLVEGSASRVTLFRLMPKTSCTSGLYVHVCCTACAAHPASAPL